MSLLYDSTLKRFPFMLLMDKHPLADSLSTAVKDVSGKVSIVLESYTVFS